MKFGEVKKLTMAPQLLSVRTRIWTGFWLLPRPVMECLWQVAWGLQEWTNNYTQENYYWQTHLNTNDNHYVRNIGDAPPSIASLLAKTIWLYYFTIVYSNKNRKSTKEMKYVFRKSWKKFSHYLSRYVNKHCSQYIENSTTNCLNTLPIGRLCL